MNGTILSLALRGLLGRRRTLVIAAMPVLVIVIAVLVSVVGQGSSGYALVGGLGFTVVLPLVALICANSVLGPEIEDGSIVYLLATPVSRYAVGVSKYVAAVLATWLLGAVPLLVTGLILDPGRPARAVGWLVAGLVAGTGYAALFLALGAWVRYAVVLGLLFTVFWEGMLGGLLRGVRWVTIRSWGQEVGSSVSSMVPSPGLGLTYAVVASVVLLAVALWLTGDRLRSFSMSGGE